MKSDAVLQITDLVTPDAVALDLPASNKMQALKEVAGRLAALAGLPEADIFRALVARENLGSTGFGEGAALPHARIRGLQNTRAVFLRLAQPVDFEANDDRPVDLICAIVGPEGSTATPLKALASACRVLRNPEIASRLRTAATAESFYDALAEAS